MAREKADSPNCPACGRPAGEAPPPGPGRCPACGVTLYRFPGIALPHRLAGLLLPMSVTADRLRNHLRRLAILRVGRIEGDCYLLPFYRMEGRNAEGEETFTVLAANVGDPRLERALLPPADWKPFEAPAPGAAGSFGSGGAPLRVLMPSLSPEEAAARMARHRWKVDRAVELFHYPFWLMRIEDCGRLEGAWVDGIEARLIHHRIRLTPPVPGGRTLALCTGLPALPALAAAAALPALALPVGAAAWVLAAPLLRSVFTRRWRG
jgi:hypothetical protein